VWHFRFGHRNLQSMMNMAKHNLVTGLDITDLDSETHCDPCGLGKMTKADVPKRSTSRATRVLELVHSDLKGPFPVHTKEGHQ
ncbi:hypothetical protein P389DRAFT_134000, partial [Cystobasidium minutum MCA 4210]|uniref:uncharacterized protein n=1 Tax=Cystobasidium minutum MCA 4210 TaxID=1397322 RepID=UPI0034D01759